MFEVLIRHGIALSSVCRYDIQSKFVRVLTKLVLCERTGKVVTLPSFQRQCDMTTPDTQPSPSKRQRTGSSSDEEGVEIVSSNTVNPLSELPHMRHTCATFTFGTVQDLNLKHCRNCFCYVCDVKVSECQDWSSHCCAHENDDVWKAKRQSMRKPISDASQAQVPKCQVSSLGENDVIEILSDDDDDDDEHNSSNVIIDKAVDIFDSNRKNGSSVNSKTVRNPYKTRVRRDVRNVPTRSKGTNQSYTYYCSESEHGSESE